MARRLWIAATVALPVIILLTIESCSRSLITLRQDLAPPGADVVTDATPSREIGWEGYRVPPAQLPQTSAPRIVTLGDSNTWGYGVDLEAAWPSVLAKHLPGVSVANMATLGYSSFQGVKTLEKYGDLLQPSLLIASFNYNDRGYVYEQIDSEAKFAAYYQSRSTLSNLLRHVYTARLLHSAAGRIGLVQREKPVQNVDVRSLTARVPPDEYRENLRKIAEYGKARNIPVIFMLLRDNPIYIELIRQGIAYREQGNYEHAIRSFSLGLNNIVSGTLARKYLTETYAEMGLHDKTEQVGQVPRMSEIVGGRSMIYLDSVYHQVMIEVGQEMGIKVVDARPFLDNPLGYLDACHPDEAGHAQIAKMMLKAIQEVAPAIAKKGSNGAS